MAGFSGLRNSAERGAMLRVSPAAGSVIFSRNSRSADASGIASLIPYLRQRSTAEWPWCQQAFKRDPLSACKG